MTIGVPTEVKTHEYRVALVPAGVRALVESGHRVLVLGLVRTPEGHRVLARGPAQARLTVCAAALRAVLKKAALRATRGIPRRR